MKEKATVAHRHARANTLAVKLRNSFLRTVLASLMFVLKPSIVAAPSVYQKSADGHQQLSRYGQKIDEINRHLDQQQRTNEQVSLGTEGSAFFIEHETSKAKGNFIILHESKAPFKLVF